MKKQGTDLVPFYRPNVTGLFEAIEKSERIETEEKERLQKYLLNSGLQAYTKLCEILTGETLPETDSTIFSQSARSKPFTSPRVRIATDYAHQQMLERFGYDKSFKFLRFPPIDSINFEVNEHYFDGLLMAVINTISAGDVPVITGGTDTLRFYGTLLAEELRKKGIKTPVVIVSSMRDFGNEDKFPESQQHVIRLLKAARGAAEYLVSNNKKGVYALVPDGVEVKEASLLDMQKPVDKISGQIDKAFVGSVLKDENGQDVRINPDMCSNHSDLIGLKQRTNHLDLSKAAQSTYARNKKSGLNRALGEVKHNSQHPKYIVYNSSYASGTVVPPLEHCNDVSSLVAAFGSIYFSGYGYRDIIIKGIPEIKEEEVSLFTGMIKLLHEKGIRVSFVNDPIYNLEQQELVPLQKNFSHHSTRRLLKEAGALFWPGCISSTQAFIRTSMGGHPPLEKEFTNTLLNEDETAAIKKIFDPVGEDFDLNNKEKRNQYERVYRENFKSWVSNDAKAVAVEYVPDISSYSKFIKALDNAGITKIISVNCTHGAMKARALEKALPRQRMEEKIEQSIDSQDNDANPQKKSERQSKRPLRTKVMVSFKYAGHQFDGADVESADLKGYKASAALRELVDPGCEVPVEVLYAEAIKSRGVSSSAVA